MKWLIVGIAVLVGVVVAGVAVMVWTGNSDAGESVDVVGQGPEGEPIAIDGARLVRSTDGLRTSAKVPTPIPGSYEYPTSDMVPESADPHPDVLIAEGKEYEVFTMWAFVFNHPDLCSDGSCDVDDLGLDTPARGGVFQVDGRIANESDLVFEGSVRLGQTPSSGSPLTNPMGSEVHFAIAPHGKALVGADLTRQLNGPIGNPSLWWSASFSATGDL
jgi:hypothetical protein